MMSGTFFLPDGELWSASSSVFYWMVDAMAEHALIPELAARLREISDENLGSLEINDFPTSNRTELVALIRDLPSIARAELPLTEHRDAVINKVESLARALAGSTPSPGEGTADVPTGI